MAEMLFGLKVIAATFGVSKRCVKEWKQAGAPIIRTRPYKPGAYEPRVWTGARYRADYDKLYEWLVKERG